MQNENLSIYYLFLRVVASHAVMFGHAASYFGVLAFTQWPQAPYIQSNAVTVFFYLSGFTIAWLCDQRKFSIGYSFEKFAFDRFCRIAIPLVPILALYAAIEFVAYRSNHPYSANFNLETFLANAFMLQSFPLSQASFEPFGTNRVLWTLSPEWWLYISYGFLALGISVQGAIKQAVLKGLFLISLVYSLAYALILPIPHVKVGLGQGLTLIWLFGAATWHLVKNGKLANVSSAFLSFLLAVSIAILFYKKVWPEGGGYSLLWNILIVVPLFLGTELIRRSKHLAVSRNARSLLHYMGAYSYTLYLSHYPMMHYIHSKGYVSQGSYGGFAVVCVVAIFLAICLAIPFEFRYKQYRDWAWAFLSRDGRVKA